MTDHRTTADLGRMGRMFEIIRLLRHASGPLTAVKMAESLDVTTRTVYRDIVTLQAMRIPIEGAAGVGYILKPGFDLPPMMFTNDEVDAIVVGLQLVGRSGDSVLISAAATAGQKIAEILPADRLHASQLVALAASGWHEIPQSRVDPALLRRAIRSEIKLRIRYEDQQGTESHRTILPIVMGYYVEVQVLAAWCELRSAFRHFRVDRIATCEVTPDRFTGQGSKLRREWKKLELGMKF